MPLPTLALRAALLPGALAVGALVPGAPAAPTALAPTPRVVTVTARDFAFDAPDSVPAGLTTLRLVNAGQQVHHLAMVRVDGNRTADDVIAAFRSHGPPPAWMHDVPGPNAPAPGKESNATVVLRPGTYVVYCVVPGPDQLPHVIKGMARTLTVTPAYGTPASATLPAAGTTMTLVDYGFDLSRPLTAGKHVVRVRNTSKQTHEVELVRLAPGKSPEDFTGWAEKMAGPPPGEPIGGVVSLPPGAQANFDVTLQKGGDYALICFWPDARDGKPHYAHGMTKRIRV